MVATVAKEVEMKHLLLTLSLLLFTSGFTKAETYPVRDKFGGWASAVCVGKQGDHWVFLTNRHVVTHRPTGRLLNVWVGSEDKKWLKAKNLRISKTRYDVASFTIDGDDGKFCGYSPFRDRFCLEGKLHGQQVRGNSRVLAGDSGGSVTVCVENKSYLAGLTFARGVGRDNTSYVIPAKELCKFVETQYGSPPQRVQYRCWGNRCYVYPYPYPPQNYQRSYEFKQSPGSLPEIEYREKRSNTPITPEPDPIGQSPPPPEPKEPTISDRQLEIVVDRWMRKNIDKVKGPKGDKGDDGDTANLNLRELSAYLMENHGDELKGETGIRIW